MSYELDPSGAGLIFSLVKAILSDWEPQDVRRYFELTYHDADMDLHVTTDSAVAAKSIADGVAKMLVERMKILKAREQRLLDS